MLAKKKPVRETVLAQSVSRGRKVTAATKGRGLGISSGYYECEPWPLWNQTKTLESGKYIKQKNCELKKNPLVYQYKLLYSSFKKSNITIGARLWMKTRNVEQCHLLSKARDFTTCLFHPHSFVVGVFWLCIWHPENEKQRLITKENWNPSSVLALLQGKVIIYWTNNSSGLVSISVSQ